MGHNLCAGYVKEKTEERQKKMVAAELAHAEVGRCASLTPPDPQLKGAWYP
jgi:hypothetical protein